MEERKKYCAIVVISLPLRGLTVEDKRYIWSSTKHEEDEMDVQVVCDSAQKLTATLGRILCGGEDYNLANYAKVYLLSPDNKMGASIAKFYVDYQGELPTNVEFIPAILGAEEWS